MATLTDGPEILAATNAPAGDSLPSLLEVPLGTPKRSAILRRVLHATGAGAIAYFLGIASNLLLLPLYLHSWSVAVYGEWMAIYSIVNCLANLDFGVTAAAVNASTMAYAREDWPTFKRIQGTAWAASLAIAAFGAALAVLPVFVCFPVERWLKLKSMAPGDAHLVFCCLAVALLANIPGRQLIAVYIAIGEFARYQWLYNAFLLSTCLATAAFLISGAGPVTLALMTMALALSTLAVAAWMLHRRDRRLVPRISLADWSTARTLAAPTGQFGLSILATALTLQAPVVLLSRVLGGPAVALFITTRTVANVIRQTTLLFRAPLRPELASCSATRSSAALGRLFRFAVGTDMIVGISMFAGLWSGGCWLIQCWSRGRIEPEPEFLRLILVFVLVEGFLVFLGSSGWATNRACALSLAQLATALASVFLAVLLVDRIGVSAIPLGAMLPLLLIMAPEAVRDACRHAGLSLRFVAGRLLLPFAIMAAFSTIFSEWLVSLAVTPEWVSTLLSMLIAGSGTLLVTGSIILTRNDRQFLRTWIFARSANNDHPVPLHDTQCRHCQTGTRP